MLRSLLDEHISPAVAGQVRRKLPAAGIVSIHQWRGGALRGAEDATLLTGAAWENLTLLTYDCRTIPAVLYDWLERGIDHAGVVFVDDRTIRQWDVGSLVRAVIQLHQADGASDWKNRVTFLRPAPKR